MAEQQSASVATLKAIANAFNAHDLDAIMEFFADDCSLNMPRGPDPWGKRFAGKAAVREGLAMRFLTSYLGENSIQSPGGILDDRAGLLGKHLQDHRREEIGEIGHVTVDALDAVGTYGVDCVVVVADLEAVQPLVIRLRASGTRVVAVGPGTTPPGLRNQADDFIAIDALDRAFAHDGCSVVNVLTDPADGHLLTAPIRSYRPTAAVREFVLARAGGTCASRGCTARHGLQIDHDTPWPAGPTGAGNTLPLHQPHHDAKTCGAWCHRLHPDTGALTQTTPLGRSYTTVPLPPLGWNHLGG